MLYQYVKRYLKNTLKQADINFTWSTLENIQFFNYVDARYTTEEFSKEISEVKEAFKDFFEPVGKIVFRYKEESGIKFKIFPYRVNPKDSKHLKKIVNIIQNNRKHIQYPYQGQSDQIAVLGKIRRDINNEVHDSDESINQKELVKYALRVALDLDEKDIITQLKRKYIIKIFTKNNVLDNDSNSEELEKREGIKNRFNGYTPEQIEETYKEVFVRGDANINYFLKDVLKSIFVKKLNFKEITNDFYEEKALKIIHSSIAKELANYLSVEEDYRVGIAGYVMRKHFQEIHELIAIELIELIYDKNRNANNFLLHYDGSVVLINHKKYKRPSLETEEGQQWNNASLIGICNLWMNTKRKRVRYEHKLADTNMKLAEIEKTLLHIKPEKDQHEKEIDTAEAKLDKVQKSHAEVSSRLKYLETTNLNSTDYFKGLENFKKSEEQVRIVKEAKSKAKAKLAAIKDANASTYQDLEFLTSQKAQLLEDLRAQDLNIDSKNSQIDPIIDSIVNVLMQRTKVLAQ